MATLEGARRHVSARVASAVGTTEVEVLAAGAAVERIVSLSRRQGAELADLARSLTTGRDGQASVEAAVMEQLSAFRALSKSLQSETGDQVTQADASMKCVDDIVVVSEQIDRLSREASILSLNAGIEASRAQPSAAAFGVVAAEMRRLSREVASANSRVHDLASRIAKILPAIAAGAKALAVKANDFTGVSQTQSEQVLAAIGHLKARVSESIRSSEGTAVAVLAATHDALSHLQFQDVTAQDLRCGDAVLHDAISKVLALMGSPHRAAELEPPEYTTLGTEGDPTALGPTDSAGEVMFF